MFFLLMIIFCFNIFSNNIILELNRRIKNNIVPEFMKNRIKKDFNQFYDLGISSESLDKASQISNNFLFARIQIINNTVSVKSVNFNDDKIDNGFKASGNIRLNFYKKILEEIASYISLPNVDFIISLCDGFVGNSRYLIPYSSLEVPILVFSKGLYNDDKLVLIPDYDVYFNSEKTLENVKIGNNIHPWNKKIDKAIWRGFTSGNHNSDHYLFNPRFNAVALSEKYPNIIDSKYTEVGGMISFDVRQLLINHNYIGNNMTIVEQIQYKYQLLLDGHTTSWMRAFWQLFSNSVIIKPKSYSIQWYYDGLIPNFHYIECNTHATDLKEKIEFLLDNDDIAKNISFNANIFAENYLKKVDMIYYIYLVLNEYAALQKFEL